MVSQLLNKTAGCFNETRCTVIYIIIRIFEYFRHRTFESNLFRTNQKSEILGTGSRSWYYILVLVRDVNKARGVKAKVKANSRDICKTKATGHRPKARPRMRK